MHPFSKAVSAVQKLGSINFSTIPAKTPAKKQGQIARERFKLSIRN